MICDKHYIFYTKERYLLLCFIVWVLCQKIPKFCLRSYWMPPKHHSVYLGIILSGTFLDVFLDVWPLWKRQLSYIKFEIQGVSHWKVRFDKTRNTNNSFWIYSARHLCFNKTLCIKQNWDSLREHIIPLECCHALDWNFLILNRKKYYF